MKNSNNSKSEIIASFIVGGEKVHLRTNTEYSFIGETMQFYKDEYGLINSNQGHQWTDNDFAKEVNNARSFPTENC
jgi:hypothetical protein